MTGIIIGAVIIVGLVFAMAKMSDMGVDANENFCDGDCNNCGSELKGLECHHENEK